MNISGEENRFYAKFLDDLREQRFPTFSNKRFREYVKRLNPKFPKKKDGTYESISTIKKMPFRRHLTFLKTLEDYGLDVSIRQAGIDFANSQYRLWHAN